LLPYELKDVENVRTIEKRNWKSKTKEADEYENKNFFGEKDNVSGRSTPIIRPNEPRKEIVASTGALIKMDTLAVPLFLH